MIKAPDVNWLAIAPMVTLMIGAFVLLLLASFVRGRDRGLRNHFGLRRADAVPGHRRAGVETDPRRKADRHLRPV